MDGEKLDKAKYILAMYDIRGKQEFIYKSSKIKEIAGASYIIRDCFKDCLYPAAKEGQSKGIFSYKENGEEDFTPEGFERHLQEGYIGEVIYDGGGNFFVLYKDIESYRQVNRRFYRKLLEETYSLRVLTSYIDEVHFDNYRNDQKELYREHRKREQAESTLYPVNTLPIVQTDYRTSLPLAKLQRIGKREEKVSYESKKKYEKYEEIDKTRSEERQIKGSELLDKLITEKGEESLLAVVYIDGNNMGAQVERCLEGKKTYEECIKALREFSAEIQRHYIEDRIHDVDCLLDKKPEEKKGRRFVVYAGDEVTFICNARDAYALAKEYLEKLAEGSPGGAPRTSCAGIAIFHSHAPFPEAYRIAEECCESGKQLMKKEEMQYASLIDFHYCQGAFGVSLEEIRREEEMEESSRPWFVKYMEKQGKEENTGLIKGKYISGEIAEKMAKMLSRAGRGNLKTLAFSARKNPADFRTELERIKAHQRDKELDFSLGGILDEEMQQKLIYDIALVYDLWFAPEKQKEDLREQRAEQAEA